MKSLDQRTESRLRCVYLDCTKKHEARIKAAQILFRRVHRLDDPSRIRSYAEALVRSADEAMRPQASVR